MKPSPIIGILLLLISSVNQCWATPCDTIADPDYLYDIEALPEITISLTETDWNTYLQNFDQWPDNRLYVPAQFTYTREGQSFTRDSVGLRPRGNTSRRRPEGNSGELHHDGAQWHHAHFGIRFTEYASGRRFFGSDRIILKWFKDDPTYVHEVFAYDLMRRFGVWSAPRASYCRLSIHINGDSRPVYMGIYELIENPRKGWLHQHELQHDIPDNKGNLWKANWGADLKPLNPGSGNMGMSDDYGYVSPTYTLKQDKDAFAAAEQELCDFTHGLHNLTNGSESCRLWLDEHVDVDLLLRALAVSVMIGHWDDYWINRNNYLFYFDSQHRFYYIPFDLDNTLGTGLYSFVDPASQDPLHWSSRSNGERPLVQKILSIPAYEERYKCYLRTLAESDYLMEPNAAMDRVSHFHDLIRDYITNDTGEDMVIIDQPASWGDYDDYRLLEGDYTTNFFLAKAASLHFETHCDDAIDPIETESADTSKFIRNNQLYIRHDGRTYDLLGHEITNY